MSIGVAPQAYDYWRPSQEYAVSQEKQAFLRLGRQLAQRSAIIGSAHETSI